MCEFLSVTIFEMYFGLKNQRILVQFGPLCDIYAAIWGCQWNWFKIQRLISTDGEPRAESTSVLLCKYECCCSGAIIREQRGNLCLWGPRGSPASGLFESTAITPTSWHQSTFFGLWLFHMTTAVKAPVERMIEDENNTIHLISTCR